MGDAQAGFDGSPTLTSGCSTCSRQGAKGQPDTTYSYAVSFAVALSSRRVAAIKRIWADGKLLRREAGDFKVTTIFRFYDGSEDQIVDPLIGSIEGIANTPAYRGLTLAVFENLELAEFGNRIPFLTFEVVADETAPAVAAVLADVSRSAIVCDAAQTVAGYAAYGKTIAAAVEPLVTSFGVELFDDGSTLRGSLLPLEFVDADELGNSADNQPAARIQREQLPARVLPAALRLSYYDPARDYQTGEARGSASEESGSEVQRELAAVLTTGDAKSLVQQMLARSWAERDTLTLRLPPGRLALEPGSKIELALSPRRWTVTKCTIDGLVVIAELRPAWSLVPALAAEAGRIVANSDIVDGEMSMALIDVPDVLAQSASEPTLLLAASTATPGWRPRSGQVGYGEQSVAIQTARRKTLLGQTLGALGGGEPYLLDAVNSVDVALVDPDQWLVSCDDDALAAGSNMAAIGGELIQFGQAAPLGPGQFRLSRLMRGRGGTEWAASGHAAGEAFVLIERDTLQPIALPMWASGTVIIASSGAQSSQATLSGEALKPPAPVAVDASWQGNGDLQLSWTRRSRQGWSWIDEIDVPLGEAREQYRVTVIGAAASLEFETGQPSLTIAASTLGSAGSGPAAIEIRQIGDCAASHPARLNLVLP
jgi:hypothetical protein